MKKSQVIKVTVGIRELLGRFIRGVFGRCLCGKTMIEIGMEMSGGI